MDEKNPPGFITYKEAAIMFTLMPEADAAQAIKASASYYLYGAVPDELGCTAQQVFEIMRADIDRDKAKYRKIVERNRKNIQSRYSATSTTGLLTINSELLTSTVEPVSHSLSYTATPCKEREKHFTPPTLEEVTEFVRERGSKVDPQYFIDFYTAKDWKVGRNKMKDWKAACRNAERWDIFTRSDAKPKGYYTREDYTRGLSDDEKQFWGVT